MNTFISFNIYNSLINMISLFYIIDKILTLYVQAVIISAIIVPILIYINKSDINDSCNDQEIKIDELTQQLNKL